MPNANFNLPIFTLFQKYIAETDSGKRLQKNGKLVAKSTLKNYKALLNNIIEFSSATKIEWTVNVKYRYTKRSFDKEKRYYQKIYKQFTDFLYGKGCTDNYVGSLTKTLRSFYIYLNAAKGYETGIFYKSFYSRREETPVIVLSREQLQFIISDKDFESLLPIHLKMTRDVMVVGCTIGLRFSDIMLLQHKNLEQSGASYSFYQACLSGHKK